MHAVLCDINLALIKTLSMNTNLVLSDCLCNNYFDHYTLYYNIMYVYIFIETSILIQDCMCVNRCMFIYYFYILYHAA